MDPKSMYPQPPPPSYDTATGITTPYPPTQGPYPPTQGSYPPAPGSYPPAPGFYPHPQQQQPVPPPAVPLIVNPQPGPTPTSLVCPHCRMNVVSRLEFEPGMKTHFMAAILCLFGCWPCVCLPYCMDSCQNANHYCPNCGAYLGAYNEI